MFIYHRLDKKSSQSVVILCLELYLRIDELMTNLAHIISLIKESVLNDFLPRFVKFLFSEIKKSMCSISDESITCSLW